MPKSLVVVILFLVADVSFTQAQRGHAPALITGHGQDSCGTWVESRRVRNSDWTHEIAWAQGFVSADNFYTAYQKAALIAAEPLDLALWFDRFCAVNPLSGVIGGTAAYIDAKGGAKSIFEWKCP
jgi:hypothetical protein